MSRITRKELKTDRFAQEVGQTFAFFEEHRREVLIYGAAALVVVLLAVGFYFYRQRQYAARERVLSQALQVLEAPVGAPAESVAGLSFATPEARDAEAAKRFGDIANNYSGTRQGVVAEYTLAAMAAEQDRVLEAEKRFKTVAESGNREYASLAQMALAEIYFGSNRIAEGEQLLRPLIAKPTIFVSSEEATIALARGIAKTKPEEARKLLEPLRSSRNTAVSQAAIAQYAEIPQ